MAQGELYRISRHGGIKLTTAWHRVWQKMKALLSGAALLPLAPLLGWGPFTHIEVTRLAWRRIRDSPGMLANDLPDRLKGHENTFSLAAASADAISVHHVMKRCPLYDYMHNWMPDNAHGVPRFGYALVHQCLHGRPHDLAIACGWLAHQMADWWAHYAPIRTDGTPAGDAPDNSPLFSGYANSFRVLGTQFYPEILDHYRVLDHALLELLYDLVVLYRPGGEELQNARPVLFGPEAGNPLTRTSERWAARLPRVPPQLVGEMEEAFGRVMRGLVNLYSLLRPFRPLLKQRVDRLISFSGVGEAYLELCADKIVEGVFQVTEEEMAQWGSPDVIIPEQAPPYAARLWPMPKGLYPGTPLLELAGWLGNLRTDVDTPFLSHLTDLLRGEPAGPHTLGLVFLLGIAATEEDGHLPGWLHRLMPPAISLVGVPPTEVRASLAAALQSRELVMAFVPAAPLDSDLLHGPKALDPASLQVIFNGYDMDRYPEYFRVEKHHQQGKIIWHCRLLQPVADGYHQVWATARDRSGVPALPFNHVVDLRTPERSGVPEASRLSAGHPVGTR